MVTEIKDSLCFVFSSRGQMENQVPSSSDCTVLTSCVKGSDITYGQRKWPHTNPLREPGLEAHPGPSPRDHPDSEALSRGSCLAQSGGGSSLGVERSGGENDAKSDKSRLQDQPREIERAFSYNMSTYYEHHIYYIFMANLYIHTYTNQILIVFLYRTHRNPT